MNRTASSAMDQVTTQRKSIDDPHESLLEQFVRHGIPLIVNSNSWFKELRYLLVLALAEEHPFRIHGSFLDDKPTFNCNQLYRLAKELGIKFEKTREGPVILRKLETLHYIGSERSERTRFRTQYFLTERGRDEALKAFKSIVVIAYTKLSEGEAAPKLLMNAGQANESRISGPRRR